MYYLIKDFSCVPWTAPQNSLFLYKDQELVEVLKKGSYPRSCDASTHLSCPIEDYYIKHLIFKTEDIDEMKYMAFTILISEKDYIINEQSE